MSPEQLARLRDILAANRQPVERAARYPHPNGWNDAMDFVETQIKKVLES